MIYRREIDGLRAVAVVPVVLCHAGVGAFSGGFVGVDVFFVISGFLITSLILRDIEAGEFSLRSFYERRARRILPALFLVILACLPFAYLWMMPEDMKAFATSVLTTLLFSSNVQFYLESGYFDRAAELKPLLHTWSLAVEEQFYILFPLLLMLLYAVARRYVVLALGMLVITSFMLAFVGGNFEVEAGTEPLPWAWNAPPTWGFFLLPARAWELLIGALVAYWMEHGERTAIIRHRLIAEFGSLTGLGLILVSIFAYDSLTPYPSSYTLLPVLGAAMVIAFATQGTVVNVLLSRPVFVGIGLISYSVYLWHYPLLVFARIRSLSDPGAGLIAVLVIATFVLAYLSWRFVEQPFRNRQTVRLPALTTWGTVAAVVLIGFFAAGRLTKGFEGRFSTEQFLAINADDARIEREMQCKSRRSGPLENACVYGDGDASIAIIGDSHARALVRPLGRALGEKGLGVADLHVAGCPPVRHFKRVGAADRCERQDAVFDYLIRSPHLRHVVIAARWAPKFEANRFDNEEGGIEYGMPTVFVSDKVRNGQPLSLAEAIQDGVRELLDAGKIVILVYPIPEAGWDVPNFMAKLDMIGALTQDVSTSHDVFTRRNRSAIAALDGVGEADRLRRVYPERMFCSTWRQGRCMASLNLQALYYDDNHLSALGAGFVVKDIVSRIEETRLSH